MATTAIQRVQRYNYFLNKPKTIEEMNKKMWNLYKDSENGKKVIELFNPAVEDVGTPPLKGLPWPYRAHTSLV